jgi:copper(I)-binding protein
LNRSGELPCSNLPVLAALLLPAFANAHEYKAGDLSVSDPWSQELPPNAPTVAAYFVIHNTGAPRPPAQRRHAMADKPSCTSM